MVSDEEKIRLSKLPVSEVFLRLFDRRIGKLCRIYRYGITYCAYGSFEGAQVYRSGRRAKRTWVDKYSVRAVWTRYGSSCFKRYFEYLHAVTECKITYRLDLSVIHQNHHSGWKFNYKGFVYNPSIRKLANKLFVTDECEIGYGNLYGYLLAFDRD